VEYKGPPQKRIGKKGEKERVLSSERARVLTVKKNMHLILNSSTGTLVTVAISTAPDGGFHCESMCSQAKPAHTPQNMLREIKVQIARRHQGGLPHSVPECVNQLEDLRGDKRLVTKCSVLYKTTHTMSCCKHGSGCMLRRCCHKCPVKATPRYLNDSKHL